MLGVPEITPVEVLKLRPVWAFRLGLTAYDTTAPPLLDGELLAIAVPTVYVALGLEYARLDGAISLTVRLIVVDAVCPVLLVTVTLYGVATDRAVGVPVMAPVDVLKLRPVGSVPPIEKLEAFVAVALRV